MSTNGLIINQVKERLLFFSPTVQGRMEREACSQDFEVIQGLGQGAFGKVFKVRHKKSKQVYALKQISKKQIKHQKMTQQIINEVKIMYSLEHPNIIKIYNHYEEEDYLYLVLECATGGQLWHKLNKQGRFDERTVKQFMIEIMSAIDYLHTRNPPIIHRDIKPENILLDANGHIKIADFGWSNVNNHQRNTYCGTLDYLAPEMIMEVGHDEKIDLWSLGVLIYELLTGKAPFAPDSKVKDPKEQQRALEDNILKVRINFPPDFPTIAKSLVQGLLQKDPGRRFGVKQMRDHPWFSNCEIPKEIKEEAKKVKAENIQEVIKDEKAQFSKEEIAQVANRNINQNNEEEQIIIVDEEVDKQQQEQQDLSKNTVFILNNKITELNKQLNEAKVLLQVKIEENKNLQQQLSEKQQNSVHLGVDQRKIRLLEEENQKLKKDFEAQWEDVRIREGEILQLKSEIEKVNSYQKSVEKLKKDKLALQEKIKKLQEEIEQKDSQIAEYKTDFDVLNTSSIRPKMQSNASSFMNNCDDLHDLTTTFLEMKKNFHIAKDQIEEFDKAQRKILQQQAEIIQLTSQLNEFKELVRQEVQDQYEEQIEELEKKFKGELREKDNEINRMQQQYESERQSLRDQINQLESYKIENEGLNSQLENLESIIKDLKLQTDMNKQLRSQYEQRIREQDIIILDLKEIEKAYRKR